MTLIKLLIIGLATTLAACNTVEGLGRDVQSGGETITGTAQDVQEQI